ncbi:MAG TPA: hypothetical protein VD838_22495, partial [Anaeromyxobacteraceae bacterium]|nr:hypothetical protein [Anaeromyxobacteraceae bacterium]
MTSTLGANGYTRRDPGFSFRFVRLLTKTAAALEIGPEGCWLLAVVVMQEDACRYKRPVYFYNRQLCDLVGIRDERTLLKLRNQLVGAGWLRYLPGGTRSPGMYYVAIPDHAQGIEDS